MHVPNPLGGYSLSLRKNTVASPRNGELLYDYTTDDLYYIDKESGEMVNVSKDIYDKIIAAKLENSKVVRCRSSADGSEPMIPEIKDREVNTWYFSTYKRNESGEEE